MQSLKEANEFTSPNSAKFNALTCLQHIIVIAESHVQEYLKEILKTLVKYLDFEDVNIQNSVRSDERNAVSLPFIPPQVKRTSELLGLFIDSDVYVPLVLNMINEEETKTAPKSLTKLLVVFSIMIRGEVPTTIETHLEMIMKVIQSIEKSFE